MLPAHNLCVAECHVEEVVEHIYCRCSRLTLGEVSLRKVHLRSEPFE